MSHLHLGGTPRADVQETTEEIYHIFNTKGRKGEGRRRPERGKQEEDKSKERRRQQEKKDQGEEDYFGHRSKQNYKLLSGAENSPPISLYLSHFLISF